MIIGIDARLYGKRGLGRYVEQLLKELESLDDENEYLVFLDSGGFKQYNPVSIKFKKILSPYQCYTWQEQILFCLQLYKYNLDLVHFTHFNVPLLYRRAFVVTIHDLILLENPTTKATTLGPLFYSLKFAVYKKVIASALRRAMAIFAISEYTKKSIIQHFSVDEGKIIVTYNGLTVLKDIHPHTTLLLRKPYLLYTGSAYPHKNLERLVNVFRQLVENDDYQLVVVGGDDYFFDQLKQYVDETYPVSIRHKIFFPGFLTNEGLSSLYKNASLYVFPSLCEGFGLPPLEAMVHNVPVVSAWSSCLPEILGNAVHWMDPFDESDMLKAIKRGLSDTQLRRWLIDNGQECIRRYNWRTLASQTLKIYNSINK